MATFTIQDFMNQYKQLTQGQRYQIYAFCKAGYLQKEIAEELGVAPSTISRELRRNRGGRGYRPKQAHRMAIHRRRTSAKMRKMTLEMKNIIEKKLELDWSPQQITCRLRSEGVAVVSHERIYQHVWMDKKLGGDLYKHLRHGKKRKKKRYGAVDSRGSIRNRVSIDQRPEIVDQRTRLGDWEGDTISGANHKGYLLTLVERKTMKTLAIQLPDKKAETVSRAIIELLGPYREHVLTITLDNGKEFAYHEKVAEGLEADIYFAHPFCSWQRGLNENTNGLLRQYFPKKMELTGVERKDVDKAARRLNNRPRKRLYYETPNENFNRHCSRKAA